MEHIAALLLVIGCSNDLAACEEISVDVPVFETQQACSHELVLAQRTHGNQFPTVFFKCVPVDPAVEHEEAELVWGISADGSLHAALEAPEVLIALNQTDRRHH